mmetsp:Transcript_16023/g.23574  ORF Transcript_16023/g.23574 Transcript_16023/m.23574 type:complete len:248 (+) Transcript_16023:194-937(+)
MSSSKTLVFGATGATGKHVVRMLLERGQKVRVIVRSKEHMMQTLPSNGQNTEKDLEIIEFDLTSLNEKAYEKLVKDCDAIISCLGHNITGRGLCGFSDRRLVTNVVKSATAAVKNSPKTKFILMNSNGVANPNGQDDPRELWERGVVCLIRNLITPHKDNEQAARYLYNLRKDVLEWCVVRPNDLIEGEVSEYTFFSKPKKSLFGAGQTTRANVAAAMVQLCLNEDNLWETWKYQMPVLENSDEYNK